MDLNKEKIEIFKLCSKPMVSVILPTSYENRKDNVNNLLNDLKSQTFKDIEIIIVRNVSPHGRAINHGFSHSQGEYVIILDDDSRIPTSGVIEVLIKTLRENGAIGMAGASLIIPPNANWFQKRATAEFPRFNMKIVDKITDSDMACHGCCAIPRKIFQEIGGEREDIQRGLDPDLRYRLRKADYRVVLAPHCYIYHPLPDNFVQFCKTFFRNGMSSAYCLKFRPEVIVETDESLESRDFKPKRSFSFRLIRFPLRLIKAVFTLKLFRFLGYLAYGIGYLYGFLKYSIIKNEKK